MENVEKYKKIKLLIILEKDTTINLFQYLYLVMSMHVHICEYE